MQKIQTGLRGSLKFLVFLIYLVLFFLVAFTIKVTTFNSKKKRRRLSQNVSFFCRWFLKTINVKVDTKNFPQKSDSFLLVSNHMGFVDVLAYASQYPLLFVTSIEVKHTPFLGLLSELGACLYVERRSRSQISNELSEISLALQEGFHVVLFPEATSTNGEQVLPFKKTLMMSAAYAQVAIQPAVINYHKVNGETFSIKWRDHICWYGDIDFQTSLWNFLSLKSIHTEIQFLEKIWPSPQNERSLIAQKAYESITAHFIPVKP